MSRRPYESAFGELLVSATLPTTDAGKATLALADACAGILECKTATASPAGTIEARTQSGTWMEVECYQLTAGTYTRRAAGATVTLATGDLVIIPAPGFTAVRWKRASGTSAVMYGRAAESLTDILLVRLLTSGLTASSTVTAEQIGFAKQLTPTVATAAYVAGDVIGGILEFTNVNSSTGRPVEIQSVSLVDKSQQSIPCTILWFSATPSGGTYTDGSALAFGSGDYAKYQGGTRFMETEWVTYPATPTDDFASKNNLGTVVAVAGTSLFALIIADVTESTTLTNGDLIVNVSGRQL